MTTTYIVSMTSSNTCFPSLFISFLPSGLPFSLCFSFPLCAHQFNTLTSYWTSKSTCKVGDDADDSSFAVAQCAYCGCRRTECGRGLSNHYTTGFAPCSLIPASRPVSPSSIPAYYSNALTTRESVMRPESAMPFTMCGTHKLRISLRSSFTSLLW